MKGRSITVVFAMVSLLVLTLSGFVGWRIGSSSDTSDTLQPSSSRPIPDAVPVVAFLGDSYSKGIGASTNGKRWTTLVSAAMGWSELNLAEGGSGYTTTYLGQKTDYSIKLDVIAAARPDIVVVAGGRNDYEAGTSAVVGAVAASLFESIKAAAPHADLIIISPIWDSAKPPMMFNLLIDSVQVAAAHAGAQYLDIGEPLHSQPELIGADGLHPNDAGHREVAEAVLEAQ